MKNYTTPPTSLLSEVDPEGNPVVDFSQIAETSAETVRKSIDGLLFIAKFVGDTPSFLEGFTQYTHAEMLEIVATPEWSNED